MTEVSPDPYPGEVAAPADLLRLAHEYRRAAVLSITLGRPKDPISLAPFRLAAIQALELYLTAFLIHAGHEPSRVRRLQHDLGARTELAAESGLCLRQRTTAHLRTMTARREYLVTRYGPEMTATLSQVSRLAATLNEVAGKATLLVAGSRT